MSHLNMTKSKAAKGCSRILGQARAERWRSYLGRPAGYARKKTCNRSREATLNWQESAEAIVRKLLQQHTEGLNRKERGNRCVRLKSKDSRISRKGAASKEKR
ncbi:hypothetical protein D3C74_230880 [compost metagenome]